MPNVPNESDGTAPTPASDVLCVEGEGKKYSVNSVMYYT